ncbi:cytochrome P450 [Favolaschia claudopus]|uniref:Cytochrome P450 n=1 Tax=Favolaschia claudopus TaxID=2862362 RepID=A0AAW0DLV4_9AGAR
MLGRCRNLMDTQDRLILLASLWLVYTLALLLISWASLTVFHALRRALYTTRLPSAPRSAARCRDITHLAERYGPVFSIPASRFTNRIVLCDPTAIAHFYANAPTVYRLTPSARKSVRNQAGQGLTWADADQHSLHRQALAPMFSHAAVAEHYFPVFYSMASKMRQMWDDALPSRPRGIIVDIQHWYVSNELDSLGVAGFQHNFDSLKGSFCTVTAAFYVLRTEDTKTFPGIISRLASSFPILRHIPTARNRLMQDFQRCIRDVAEEVLRRDASKGNSGNKSMLGLLIKSLAEHPGGEYRLSHAEVVSQVCLWIFVELAKNPDIQDKLRQELHQVDDIQYRDLAELPYLRAVVNEGLRLHPPTAETTRMAATDDIIPLSSPILVDSDTVGSISVAKGTLVTAPIQYINTSETFWGAGADKFDPGRWWQDQSNNSFPGNRHLAFGDGPRNCRIVCNRGQLYALLSGWTTNCHRDNRRDTSSTEDGRP